MASDAAILIQAGETQQLVAPTLMRDAPEYRSDPRGPVDSHDMNGHHDHGGDGMGGGHSGGQRFDNDWKQDEGMRRRNGRDGDTGPHGRGPAQHDAEDDSDDSSDTRGQWRQHGGGHHERERGQDEYGHEGHDRWRPRDDRELDNDGRHGGGGGGHGGGGQHRDHYYPHNDEYDGWARESYDAVDTHGGGHGGGGRSQSLRGHRHHDGGHHPSVAHAVFFWLVFFPIFCVGFYVVAKRVVDYVKKTWPNVWHRHHHGHHHGVRHADDVEYAPLHRADQVE